MSVSDNDLREEISRLKSTIEDLKTMFRQERDRKAAQAPQHVPMVAAGPEDQAVYESMAASYRAAQAPAVPERWRPVPVEPTAEMIKAWHDAYTTGNRRTGRSAIAYRAMLAAAPQAPTPAASAAPAAAGDALDAARYRWLREQVIPEPNTRERQIRVMVFDWGNNVVPKASSAWSQMPMSGSGLDAEVDAAMSAGRERNK